MTNDPQSPQPLDYHSPGIAKPRKPAWRDWRVYALLVVIGWLAATFIIGNSSDSRNIAIADRVLCASKLHQMGLAIIMYANDNNGQYPPSLATLLVDEQITPQVFICPDSSDTPATGATTQALAADLTKPGHCSYIYLGSELNSHTATATTVIAYEPLADHRNTGMNVLFGDGHVTWETAAVAARLLAKVAATSRPVTLP